MQLRAPASAAGGLRRSSAAQASHQALPSPGIVPVGGRAQGSLLSEIAHQLPKSAGSSTGSEAAPQQQRARVVASAHSAVPPAQGLFDPANDRDACGVGFVGELNKVATRKCITDSLTMLCRMEHRGACGCEANTGRGGGQIAPAHRRLLVAQIFSRPAPEHERSLGRAYAARRTRAGARRQRARRPQGPRAQPFPNVFGRAAHTETARGHTQHARTPTHAHWAHAATHRDSRCLAREVSSRAAPFLPWWKAREKRQDAPPCLCPRAGDGAGILVAMPDAFLSNVLLEEQGIKLPPYGACGGACVRARDRQQTAVLAFAVTTMVHHLAGAPLPPAIHCAGEYAVGQIYLPRDETLRHKSRTIIDTVVAEMGHDAITWRVVPTNNRSLGQSALATEPVIEQLFIHSRGKLAHLQPEQQVRRQARPLARQQASTPAHRLPWLRLRASTPPPRAQQHSAPTACVVCCPAPASRPLRGRSCTCCAS